MKPWLQAGGSNLDLDGHTGQFTALAVAAVGGLDPVAKGTVSSTVWRNLRRRGLREPRPPSGLVTKACRLSFQLSVTPLEFLKHSDVEVGEPFETVLNRPDSNEGYGVDDGCSDLAYRSSPRRFPEKF
jgi:hypothetical protein